MDKRHPVRKVITALVEGNARFFGRKKPVVRRYELPLEKLPQGFDGCRIAQISDLHAREFGAHQKHLIEALRQAAPDYIFVTGDLLECEYGKERPIVTDMLNALPGIAPTYFALGNHETRSDDDILAAELADIRGAGIEILDGTCATLSRGGDSAALGGLWVKPECPLTELTPIIDPREQESADRLKAARGEGFFILLAHRPECVELYQSLGADLVFSGHDHGGLMHWGRGGLIAPGQGWFAKRVAGIFRDGDMTTVISAGLGGPRIFIAPEIPIVTLKVIHS